MLFLFNKIKKFFVELKLYDDMVKSLKKDVS